MDFDTDFSGHIKPRCDTSSNGVIVPQIKKTHHKSSSQAYDKHWYSIAMVILLIQIGILGFV